MSRQKMRILAEMQEQARNNPGPESEIDLIQKSEVRFTSSFHGYGSDERDQIHAVISHDGAHSVLRLTRVQWIALKKQVDDILEHTDRRKRPN